MLAGRIMSFVTILGYGFPGQAQQEAAPPTILYIVLDDTDTEVIERYMPTVRDEIQKARAEFTNSYYYGAPMLPVQGQYPPRRVPLRPPGREEPRARRWGSQVPLDGTRATGHRA
jgi:hypothetical protein